MINSYKDLSLRYLKYNKKRALLTMIGIIMSVTLISSVAIFFSTVEGTIYKEVVEQGNFEVIVTKPITNSEFNKIKSNPQVEFTAFIKKSMTNTHIKNMQIELNTGNEKMIDALSVKLEEGRLPTKVDEIVLEDWIMKYFDSKPQLGSKITLDVDNQEKEFTLVGITKDSSESQSKGLVNAYNIDNSMESNSAGVLTFVNLVDFADKRSVIEEIKTLVGKDNVIENTMLLAITGESIDEKVNNSLYYLMMGVIGVIVLATITVIYNSFHISIADRVKQFGQLRAMGITKKQIRALVIREATIMTIITVPIGIITGLAAVYIIALVFNVMTTGNKLEIIINPKFLVISTIISVVTVYISAFLPARAASKISSLVAINNSTLIGKETIKRKRLNIISKLFKIDKVMAIKNIKRNKKRFYVTAASMAISVLLVVSCTPAVKAGLEMIKSTKDKDYSFIVEKSQRVESLDLSKELSEEVIKEISNIKGITGVFAKYRDIDLKAIVDENKIQKVTGGYSKDTTLDGKNKKCITVEMCAYDENKIKELKKYLVDGNIENLKANEVIAIKNQDVVDDKIVEGETNIPEKLNLKVGDEIQIDTNYYNKRESETSTNMIENSKESYQSGDLKTVKVGAVINMPKDLYKRGYSSIIIRSNDLKNLIANNEVQKENLKVYRLDIKIDNKDLVNNIELELIKTMNNYPELSLINTENLAKSEQNKIIKIAIVVAGFVGIIILISSINIINTVSTNIIVRKRELASLKAIGMTSKELRNMVCLEGAIFGLYGGVVGCVLGGINGYGISQVFKKITGQPPTLPWSGMIISLVAVILIGYLSALLAMRKLSKSNIIEAMKYE